MMQACLQIMTYGDRLSSSAEHDMEGDRSSLSAEHEMEDDS